MSNNLKVLFVSFTIVAIIMFSAFGATGTAFAGGDAPPVPTDSTKAVANDSSPASVKNPPPPAEDPAPSPDTPVTAEQKPAVVVETPLPDVKAAEKKAAAPTIMEQLPENTALKVVDSNGQVQPLATQASANAIASTSDPLWCPAGQAPTPGANGCTSTFSNFTDLLTFLQANETDVAYQQAGTIFVEQGQYLGGESSIDFNNYTFTTFNNFNLTLQAGWDPLDNSTDPADTTQFNAPITIGSSTNPWIGSLTLYNINISNATGQTGLALTTQGNITLGNVAVSGSLNGALLTAGGDVTINDSNFDGNSHAGATLDAGGNVDVRNSSFSNNGSGSSSNPTGSGLTVSGTGTVTLDSVAASHNQLFGANIQSGGVAVVMNSFFDGNQSIRPNTGYGLQVVSTDVVVLDTISASDNSLFGADLDGAGVVVDTSTFDNNQQGLNVNSSGFVSLSNVEAKQNSASGANVNATADVAINDSFFSGQTSSSGGYGLRVVSSGGPVGLTNVEAINNYSYGAHLEGTTVTIFQGNFSDNGSGVVDRPTGFGLEVMSSGQVTLDSVTANNNELFGANIQAGDTVTVANSFFSGNKGYVSNPRKHVGTYYGYGLQVTTTAGTISLDGVEGNNNNLWGGMLTGLNINVANSIFDNNTTGSPVFIDDTGLVVESTGNVALDNVEANGNRLFGATIHATGDVLINASVFSGNRGITCPDLSCQQITYNGYGLNVVSGGYVELNQVTAQDNYLVGAHLEGSSVGIFSSTFNNDATGDARNPIGRGLEVVSTGEVTLMNVEASHNERFGADIQASGPVTVLSSIFSGNSYSMYSAKGGTMTAGYGLQIVSSGAIVLGATTDTPDVGVQASGNGAEGAILMGPSTITATNSSFNDNGAEGLKITANGGNVTLTNTTASGNDSDGVNVTGVCTNTLFVDGGTFSNNAKYGIRLASIIDSLIGSPVFAGNGSGNIFRGSTCVTGTPTGSSKSG